MSVFHPIADIQLSAHNQEMTASSDHEELATLRYFMRCYWHQNADLVHGDLGPTAAVFTSSEKPTMVRELLADLAEVRARGLFSRRWPKKGPLFDFWANMGDRILSQEEAELVAEIAERHLK